MLAIFLGALALRIWGVDFGRPYSYPPDEWVVLTPAVDMVRTGDWNPHQFLYPSALIYAESGVVAIVHALRGTPLDTTVPIGLAGLAARSVGDVPVAQFPYVLGGRLLVATLGALTVVFVFLAARRLTTTIGAFGAAAIMAISPLHVVHSHFLTTDVPAAFIASLTLLLALVGRDRGWRWLVAAGFAAGLAASTKYNVGLVVIVPILLQLCTIPHRRDRWIRHAGTTLLVVVASMVGFAVATPAVIFDTESVVSAIQFQFSLYNSGAPGAEGDSARFYAERLFTDGLGTTMAVPVLVGIVTALRRHRPGDVATLGFAGCYLALISSPVVHFDRNLMPVVPYLAVLGGIGVEAVVGFASAIPRIVRRPWLDRWSVLAAALVLAVACWQPLAADVANGRSLQLPDTRTLALEWIQANLPRGSAIVREAYTPKVPVDEFRVGTVWLLSERSLDWYRTSGARYLIASSSQFGRFTDYPVETAFYEDLFAQGVIHEVGPSEDALGPRIMIVDLGPSSEAAP